MTEIIYPMQYRAGTAIAHEFSSGHHNVLLLAQPQQGKTGAMIAAFQRIRDESPDILDSIRDLPIAVSILRSTAVKLFVDICKTGVYETIR